jgi:two-component system, OmpR family, response regulator
MPLRILLAEDFDDCATTTAALLRHFGHAVRVTRDGPDTIAACRVELPDVVLLDIGLPKMNGHDVAIRLREEFGAATPRLIALTGFGQPADRRRSVELGIEAHLIKPVDLSELNALLANGNGRSHGGSPSSTPQADWQ